MVRVAINGFGRIGRMILKAGFKDKKVEFVAINDLTDTKTLAHLLKYDSIHGRFPGKVEFTADSLIIDGKTIKVFAMKEPEKLPWKDLKIDVVCECTGIFTKESDIRKHIQAGAKKVLLSAPPKEGDIPLYVMGVNDSNLKKDNHEIISNASCTTNCLAPITKVINDSFGIENGFMTTVHAYTADQRLVDAPHSDLRRARSAAVSLIPTSTGAAKSIGKVIPELNGKMDGVAIRAPVPDGSITDMVFILKKEATIKQINDAIKNAANGAMKGIIEYCEDPIVSVDIIGNPASSIFDSLSTMVIGRTAKLLSWYDNEWGYSCRMIDLIKKMA